MPADRILEAVATVLAGQGIDALSIRRVAAAAGVSPAQVQYYYRTKRDLVRAAFEYSADAFVSDVAAMQSTSWEDAVSQWLPLDAPRERRAHVWLAYSAMAVTDPVLAVAAAELDEGIRRWFVERGMTMSEAALLFAAIDGLTVQCLTVPLKDRSALIERVLPALLAGVVDASG